MSDFPFNFDGGGATLGASQTKSLSHLLGLLKLKQQFDYLLSKEGSDVGQPASDPFLAKIGGSAAGRRGRFTQGTILSTFGHTANYLVTTGDREPNCLALRLMSTGSSVFGVRDNDTLAPGTGVVLWRPEGSSVYFILGVVPNINPDFRIFPPTYIQRGSTAGFKKKPYFRNAVSTFADGINIVSRNNGRPIDSTDHEFSRLTETGAGIFIDSYQSFLRVSELCGIWLNVLDEYMKLSAVSFDFQSFSNQVCHRLDEGEIYLSSGYSYYAHEALGAYRPGVQTTQQSSLSDVQMSPTYGQAELDLSHPDIASIHRLIDYYGYVGYGQKRFVSTPRQGQTSVHRLSQAEFQAPTGLLKISQSLTGAYYLQSAKSVFIGKSPIITTPIRKRSVEDPKGDDSKKFENKYRFAGAVGGDVEHKAGDWRVQTGDELAFKIPAYNRISGLEDITARARVWDTEFGFRYHEDDFFVPEESDNPVLSSIEFHRGHYNRSHVEAQPVDVPIDDITGVTKVYRTSAGVHVTEDGSVVISDGYGSQLVMSCGQIRLESGGDVLLLSGSRVVSRAKDVILQAKNNVDISATENDVRIKSEVNTQILAGNSGVGGLLLESKGQGNYQNYENKSGAEVRGSGITLLSRGGGINAVGSEIYLRSGVQQNSAVSGGSIVIDSGSGGSPIFMYGSQVYNFTSDGVVICTGIRGQGGGTPSGIHYFGDRSSLISGDVRISGSTVGIGSALFGGGVTAVGNMACSGGYLSIGDTSRGPAKASLQQVIQKSGEVFSESTQTVSTVFNSAVVQSFLSEQRVGSTTLLENSLGFSFRDSDTDAYGYIDGEFLFPEARWQQLTRMGLVAGTEEQWVERPVEYQTGLSYPWPGKKNLADEENPTYLKYAGDGSGFMLFDKDKRAAKSTVSNRQLFEEPTLPGWSVATMNSSYSL